MTAACTGITSDRNTTSRSSAASPITTAMNSGSLLESTCEKSTCEAVEPPTYTCVPVLRSIGGRMRVAEAGCTRRVVCSLCGEVVG